MGEEEKLDDCADQNESEEEKLEDDEAKSDEAKEPEKVFTLEMPEDTEGISEEAVEVTVKTLSRGKVAILKYVEAIKRMYDIITAIYPDLDRAAQNASLTILKDFSDEITTSEHTKVTLTEEVKKVFAYHVEVCKKGTKIFEPTPTSDKAEPDENLVLKLFKKAPKLSVDKVNEVINKGAKIMKEKQALLDGLNDLNVKMQIVDNALCTLLVESNTEERHAWQFFQENSDKIIELFPLLGAPELVILQSCKDIGNKVLDKMSICRKNWTSLGTQITEKSPTVSNLVSGPLVTADQLAEKKNLTTLAPETRSTLINVISGIKKKTSNNVTDYVKSHMSPDDLESFNYIANDLEGLMGKRTSKSLCKEEKMYVGYHLSKVRPYVQKITELHQTKTVLEGSYPFHERSQVVEHRPDVKRSYGSQSYRRGGDYRREEHRNGGGYRSSRGSYNHKSFNHYGAY